MSAIDAFMSTWSNARSTLGEGTPQDGRAFDNSAQLRQMQTATESAAAGPTWSGPAADAYADANSGQGRVLGQMAGLDQRLGGEVDRSAAVVVAGRQNLDNVKRWVQDAASAVPEGANRDQALVPIARKGIGDVADVVAKTHSDLNAIGARIGALADEYRKLQGDKANGSGGPQFAGPDPKNPGSGDPAPTNKYEQALREAGLLSGPRPTGRYQEWLQNAQRRGIPPETIVEIARQQHLTPDSFTVLDKMEEIKDPDGKSFFLVPKGASADEIRRATLMTYVLNCGTDYGAAPGQKDFAETPYSAAEVDRIARRQMANGWSYAGAWAIEQTGGSLVTTPNGMLMGLGGKVQDTLSCQGGTTYGDIFMVNIDHSADPAQQLRDIVRSGRSWEVDSNGMPYPNGDLDLDRLLHHEERHSQQYARFGLLGMGVGYTEEEIRRGIFGGFNWFEKDAGLHDGGYE